MAQIKTNQPLRFGNSGCLWQWTKRLLLSFVSLVVLILLTGLIYQASATKIDEGTYPPPGRLIDMGGYRLHLNCMGAGQPTVILEAGLGDSSLTWGLVQPEIARFTQVCAYDRAGLGWSDPGPQPRTSQQIVTELHTLLSRAGIE